MFTLPGCQTANASPSESFNTLEGCKFPKYPRKTSNKAALYALAGLTWLSLLMSLDYLAVAITFTIKFTVKTRNLGPDLASADFALYKNSRFDECLAKTPPDDATCSDV